MSPLELPSQLSDRYRLLRELGAGGFGRVLLVQDLETGRQVALKLLEREVQQGEARERFLREARITARLRHPNIVEIFEVGTAGDQPFILYEYHPGLPLSAPRELIVSDVLEWAKEISSALAAAHEAGVIHRDVKPENILVGDDGRAVLADFGAARDTNPEDFRTAEGLILGTPQYLAPEIYLGSPPGPAADQFAWAATFLRVIAGVGVYPDEGVPEILTAVQAGYRPPLVSVPGRLGSVLRQALSRDPRDRFASMQAVAQALSSGEPAEDAPAAPEATERILSASMGGEQTRPVVARSRGPGRDTPSQGKTWLLLPAVALGLLLGLGVFFASAGAPESSKADVRPSETSAEALVRRERVAWTALLDREEKVRRSLFGDSSPTPWNLPKADAPIESWKGYEDAVAGDRYLRLFDRLIEWILLAEPAGTLLDAGGTATREKEVLRQAPRFLQEILQDSDARIQFGLMGPEWARHVGAIQKTSRYIRKELRTRLADLAVRPTPGKMHVALYLGEYVEGGGWISWARRVEALAIAHGAAARPMMPEVVLHTYRRLGNEVSLGDAECQLRSRWTQLSEDFLAWPMASYFRVQLLSAVRLAEVHRLGTCADADPARYRELLTSCEELDLSTLPGGVLLNLQRWRRDRKFLDKNSGLVDPGGELRARVAEQERRVSEALKKPRLAR